MAGAIALTAEYTHTPCNDIGSPSRSWASSLLFSGTSLTHERAMPLLMRPLSPRCPSLGCFSAGFQVPPRLSSNSTSLRALAVDASAFPPPQAAPPLCPWCPAPRHGFSRHWWVFKTYTSTFPPEFWQVDHLGVSLTFKSLSDSPLCGQSVSALPVGERNPISALLLQSPCPS